MTRWLAGDDPAVPLVVAEITASTADAVRRGIVVAGGRADALCVPCPGRRHAAGLPYELLDFRTEAPGAGPDPADDLLGLAAGLVAAQGLRLIAGVGEDTALARVKELDLLALYLPADVLTDLPFVARAAADGRPILLGTGMASMAEVEEAVAAVLAHHPRLALVHALETRPGRHEETNLRALVSLRERFALPVGFRAAEASPETCLAATALGAALVMSPLDAAADAAALAAVAGGVRTVARALGDGDKRVQPSEWALRDRRHRSVVATVDIPQGARLTADMLGTAAPGIGLKPRLLPQIVGKRAAVDVPRGTLVTLAMLDA
jgi:sialic acid synthase SpsE